MLADPEIQKSTIQQLKTTWLNEKFAPEILAINQTLIDSLLEKLSFQSTSSDIYLTSIYAQEAARIKYLIKSYLRVRLLKIEKFALSFLINQDYRDKLSPSELEYAQGFQQLLESYYSKSFLDSLPEDQRSLTEVVDGSLKMVPEHDLDDSVFCRVNEDVGIYRLEDRNVTIDFKRNEIHLLRYKSVRTLIHEGKLDLF